MNQFLNPVIQFGVFAGLASVKTTLMTSAGAVLLFASCLCIGMSELKVRRRDQSRNERLAFALASAVRSGTLDFESGQQISGSLWGDAADADEEDRSELLPALFDPSRYQLLGYGTGEKALDEPVVRTYYMGGGPEIDAEFCDDDLMLGVPRIFMKPQLPRAVEAPSMLALPAGNPDLRRSRAGNLNRESLMAFD
jgi:hypothetical protein